VGDRSTDLEHGVMEFAFDTASQGLMYAVTYRGLFRSTDSGSSWRPAGTNQTLAAFVAATLFRRAPGVTALAGGLKSIRPCVCQRKQAVVEYLA
jgi:hypothetical protein